MTHDMLFKAIWQSHGVLDFTTRISSCNPHALKSIWMGKQSVLFANSSMLVKPIVSRYLYVVTHKALAPVTRRSDCFMHTAGWLIIMWFYATPQSPLQIEPSTPPHPLRAWDALTVISLWQHLDVPSLSRPCYWDDSPENVAIMPKRASDEQLFHYSWKTTRRGIERINVKWERILILE